MYAFKNVCLFCCEFVFIYKRNEWEEFFLKEKDKKKNILEINDRFKPSQVRSPKSESNQDDWIYYLQRYCHPFLYALAH